MTNAMHCAVVIERNHLRASFCLSSISIMVSQEWNRNTFGPGDRITVVAHPNRNGSKDVLL